MLTAYDGKPITYDVNGNPLSDGTWTYTWQHGRQLASMTSDEAAWVFTYNADGLRTKRTDSLSGNTYTYVYDGSQLSYLKVYDGETLYFTYADDGRPFMVWYDGEPFFYVTNLQGDVVALLDATGTEVVSYSYDAWGKLLSCTGTMADTIGTFNPLRYRGYVYDTETGLYYLQSRYYNPELGRFINADEYIDSRCSTGYNLFSYCWNNPVNLTDYTGQYVATLVLSSSLTYSLSNALAGMMTGITASIAGIKAAIASSWLIPVCVAATAIAVVGIVAVVNRVKSLSYSATRVISAVQTKIKAKGVNPNSLKSYTVYVIARKGTTDVVYVGMTKNYSSRKTAHSRRFPSSKYTMMPIATGLSYAQARALEQTLITAYTLDTLKNMINSISPKRWGFFKSEFEQMNLLIQSWLDPE